MLMFYTGKIDCSHVTHQTSKRFLFWRACFDGINLRLLLYFFFNANYNFSFNINVLKAIHQYERLKEEEEE
uniref:CSON002336 protein n=1 Tax=Culicoides sonorensis TaxID=179676 RepID=A0A336MPX9_CULSO